MFRLTYRFLRPNNRTARVLSTKEPFRFFAYRLVEKSVSLNQLKSGGRAGVFKAMSESTAYDLRKDLRLSFPSILSMVDSEDLKVYYPSNMERLVKEEDMLMNLPSNVGTEHNPLLITYTSSVKSEIKTFVKIVRLLPSQELTQDMIFNTTRTIVTSLESYKDLDDLIKEIKLLYPSTLGGVDKNDITLWELSDQLLACFEDTLLELSSLPDNVGGRNNPLVLAYVDHNIRDINMYVKIVQLVHDRDLSEDMISMTKDMDSFTLPSNSVVADLVKAIKLSNPDRLGAEDIKDIKLLNSKNLAFSFDNSSLKLSELPEKVGSCSNPLVLVFPDRILRIASKFRSFLPKMGVKLESCAYDTLRTPIVGQYFDYLPRSQESSNIVRLMMKRQLNRKGFECRDGLVDENQLKSILDGPEVSYAGEKVINPLIAVVGCPGIGKSTFLANFPHCDEFKHYVRKLCDNELGVIVSPVTYVGDMDGDFDVTGLRFLFGTACSMSGLATNSWNTFVTHFDNYRTLNVVDAVKVLKNVYGMSRRVLLLVDEIRLADMVPHGNTTTNKMMQQLGPILSFNGTCDVIVSALSPQYALSLATSSSRQVEYCIISPLWDSAIGSAECDIWTGKVIKKLKEFDNMNKNEFIYRLLRSMYLLASGHPRMLQYLANNLKTKDVHYANILSKLGNNKTQVSGLLIDLAAEMESSPSLSVNSFNRIQCFDALHCALSTNYLTASGKDEGFIREQIEDGRILIVSACSDHDNVNYFPVIRLGAFIKMVSTISKEKANSAYNSTDKNYPNVKAAISLFKDLVNQPLEKSLTFSRLQNSVSNSSRFENSLSTWWKRIVALNVAIYSFDGKPNLFGSSLPFLKFKTTLTIRLASKSSNSNLVRNNDLLRNDSRDELIMTPLAFPAVDSKVFIGDQVIYLKIKIAKSSSAKKSLSLVFAKSTLCTLLHHYSHHPSIPLSNVGLAFYVWSNLDSTLTKNSTKFILSQCISNIQKSISSYNVGAPVTPYEIVSNLSRESLKNTVISNNKIIRPLMWYLIEYFFSIHNSSLHSRINESEVKDIFRQVSDFLIQSKSFLNSTFDSNVDVLTKNQLNHWLIPSFRPFPRLVEEIEKDGRMKKTKRRGGDKETEKRKNS